MAPGIGYCGLDRRRLPLLGNELRSCWEAAAARVYGAATPASGAARIDGEVASGGDRARLDFVPVGEAPGVPLNDATTGTRARKRRSPASSRTAPPPPTPVAAVGTRIGLWDEMDVAGPGQVGRPG
ncbi:MAG: hypothetical protein AABZ33_13750 [Chloroflexota bacterium]